VPVRSSLDMLPVCHRPASSARTVRFRADICPVGTDRASVTRCRWSLLVAVGRCGCCHRCCQLASGPQNVCGPATPGAPGQVACQPEKRKVGRFDPAPDH
jgi:hypothetical protein